VSRPAYVPEDPLRLLPGVPEMLSDPAQYRRSEMAVVDYSAAPPADDLLLPSRPEPEPSRLRRFLSWLTREAEA
jgi:hypothetical protein